jgi:hypothetical protein
MNNSCFKICSHCGNIFYRQNETSYNWKNKIFCSCTCKVKARKKRYKKTEVYKEAEKRYRQSEKGKIIARQYKTSAKNKEYNKMYRASGRATEAYVLWSNSEKGRQWREKTRLIRLMRTRICKALKKNSVQKDSHTTDFIGCSIKQLREWLELQFQPGMTWSNYGQWHVDHIIPIAAFDLHCPAQQWFCFNYRNLQPLWAEDNLIKSAKYAVA